MPKGRKSKSERPVEFARSEPLPVFYANHAGISITPWDFGFRFGTITEASEKKLKVQEALHVYMSPQHAKAFLALVNRQVKLYEEKYGTIPEPKQPTGKADEKVLSKA